MLGITMRCIGRHYTRTTKERRETKRMTDRAKFYEVIRRNGKKVYEVACEMGMSPQSLQNKLGNAYPFTQTEMSKFRSIFPDVTDEDFKSIFFAVNEFVSNQENNRL